MNEINLRPDWNMWWPAYDRWPERTYAYVQRHLKDVEPTIAACRGHGTVVQAGGHVGLWPRRLAQSFKRVITFEPDAVLFQCLNLNCGTAGLRWDQVSTCDYALGRKPGTANLTRPEKAGSNTLTREGGHPVRMTSIDHHLALLQVHQVDAIILDIEGGEANALRGASMTISRDRPVIHVEEIGQPGRETRAYLESIGYRRHARAGHDWIYLPGDKP